MKYKEFQSGAIEVPSSSVAAWNTGAAISRYTETCAEHTIAAFDVVNRDVSNQLFFRFLSGWDSLAQRLYSPVFGAIASFVEITQGSATTAENAVTQSQRMKRVENITQLSNAYGNNSAIPANQRGTVLCSVADVQLLDMQFQRQAGSGDVEILGIFKGGLEGISSLFEVTTVGGTSAWIDCRAYGYAGFEVLNTGGTTLTDFSVEIRRHPLGTSNSVSLNLAPFVESNPVKRIQRIRNLNPGTLTVGDRGQVDFDITEAHSIRFVLTPTNAQATIRGILKG